MYKKSIVIILLIFIVQFISMSFYGSYAKVYTSLSKFVQENGIESMTEKELEEKNEELLKELTEYNQNTAITVSNNVSDILRFADQYQNYDEKMKYLESEFKTQAEYAAELGEETVDYLYYGFMLGGQWVIYKQNKEEANKPENDDKTIAEQFDETYKEYKSLSEEEKKDILTLKKYKDKLSSLYDQLPEEDKTDERLEQLDEVDTAVTEADSSISDLPSTDPIYIQPDKDDDSRNAGDSLDDMFNDADDFINSGNQQYGGNSKLQQFSNMIYNILLAVGVAVAVIVGAIIGVKLMASNIDTKAEAKKLLIPYVVGCVVVFGGFGIWKIVVSILQGM